jgi:DNA-binding response OmpR family regulator
MDAVRTEHAELADGNGSEAGPADTLVTIPKLPGVLIVDDEARVRALLKVKLREHGCHTFLADRGDEAVQLYQRHHGEIDLVLLDADASAPATLRALRTLDGQVRCCLLTDIPDPVAQTDWKDLGTIDVVTKATGLEDLVKLVWSLILKGRGALGPVLARLAENGPATPTERRAVPRFPAKRSHTCWPAQDKSQACTGELSDVSVEGIRFLADREWEVGALLALALPGPPNGAAALPLARVVRVDRHPSGLWSLACTFTRRLSEPQLQALMARG